MTPDLLAPLRAALSAARNGPLTATPRPGVPAAVLVPLFERDGALHLLYTTRSTNLAQHAGQVAFPGGRHTPSADENLLATALRETGEEIGVAAHDVDVLGVLDPIHTFSSNFSVTPFVATIPHPYAFRPNPHEVSEVFSIPLATLADPKTVVEETWTIDGHTVPIVSYRHEGRAIWGATQRITSALLDLLTAIRANQD
jgi:8-oxo-dGTP pyrophosphatase MutT (NUDIX family)